MPLLKKITFADFDSYRRSFKEGKVCAKLPQQPNRALLAGFLFCS